MMIPLYRWCVAFAWGWGFLGLAVFVMLYRPVLCVTPITQPGARALVWMDGVGGSDPRRFFLHSTLLGRKRCAWWLPGSMLGERQMYQQRDYTGLE